MAAFEVLSEICQEFGDKLVNGPVGSFPRVDVSQTTWTQPGGNALIRDRDERVVSSNAAMSAMYAVMKMFYSRQDSYINLCKSSKEHMTHNAGCVDVFAGTEGQLEQPKMR